MGSIISAIRDDMDDYERRCKKYGEAVRFKADHYGNDLPDCYGEHAAEMRRRERRDRRAALPAPDTTEET